MKRTVQESCDYAGMVMHRGKVPAAVRAAAKEMAALAVAKRRRRGAP